MKTLKITAALAIGSMLTMQQAIAASPPYPSTVVPEIDGSGAIIAIALIGVLVALFREKFFRK